MAPDAGAYRDYRRFLLMSSQVRGSFYTRPGIRNAAAEIAPKMMDYLDPYERAFQQAGAVRAEGNVTPFRTVAQIR